MRSAAVLLLCAATACTSVRAERLALCPPPGPRTAPGEPAPPPGDAGRGAALFASECAGCHATTGPRLDCADFLAAASDAYLYHAIARGPGRYGHGSEPPLGLLLAPQQIADLVAFLRSEGGP